MKKYIFLFFMILFLLGCDDEIEYVLVKSGKVIETVYLETSCDFRTIIYFDDHSTFIIPMHQNIPAENIIIERAFYVNGRKVPFYNGQSINLFKITPKKNL